MRLAAAAVLLLFAAAARADSIADEADFRFHRGTRLYRQGRVEDALSEFLASNRLVRNRNVLFNIARCFEELQRPNEAFRWYTELEADELPASDRKELDAALRRLRPSLALLRMESSPPGAVVYVERKDLGARGQTPVTLALAAGPQILMVEAPGYRPWRGDARLAAGKTVAVRAELERIFGTVALDGEPAVSELRVDQGPPARLVGNRAQVAPGRHVLTLSAPGHADEHIAVEVPADGVIPLRFRLLPLPPPSGTLVVRANVDGALLRIDGREVGFTPAVVDKVAVGWHMLEIAAEGRETLLERIELGDGEHRSVEAKLRYAMPRVIAAERELTGAQDAPASVTVIPAEEIRGFGYTTLAEALQPVRGLYTTYDRGYATLGVRGFGSPGVYNSRVLVLSDGHVTNESSLGQGYLGHDFDADLSDVERIEVVRGPGSVTYGSAAFFAVINVVHRTPPKGFHGEIGGLAGTLGENSGHGIVSAASESSFLWVRASGLRMSGEPFFANPGDPAQVARNLDEEHAGHLDLRATSGDFTLLASWNDRRKDLPTAAYDTAFGVPGTYTSDRRGFLEAQYNHAFASGLRLEARAAYDGERYNGYWQYVGRPAGTAGSDLSAEDWGTAEVRVRLPEARGHRLFAGAEVQDRFRVHLNAIVPADVNGNGATHWSNFADGAGAPDAVPNAEWLFSGYAGDDWKIGSRAQLDAAVRVDVYKDNFPAGSTESDPPAAVNPRLALLLQPYEGGHTKALFGRAFRYPGFYERYYNDGGVSQARAVRLLPEVVYTAELEHAHQVSDEVSVTAAVYLSEMEHLIFIGSPPGQPTISQYQNRRSPVHAAGGEIELRWQAAPGCFLSAWYAHTIVREDAAGAWFHGSPVPNSPASTGAVRALYPLVPGALSLSTELIYGGPRRSIPDPDGSYAEIGEALIWNAGITGEYPRYRLRYGAFVNNLLDERPALPAGPEISFPNHAIPQYGRVLRLQLSAAF